MATDALTVFLGLTKPTVNDPAGEDLWGEKINTNFDKIDLFASQQGVLVEAPQDNKVYGRGTPNAWIETVDRLEYNALATSVATNTSSIAAVEGANAAQDATIAGKEPSIATGNAAYVWHGDKTWKPEAPFPEAPADGQLYSRKGSTAAWVVASAGAVVSDTPPTGMPISTIWWNSLNGGLFIDYQDPNTRQWVMVNAAGMPEANIDGKAYARKDGGWFDLTASFAAKVDVTTYNAGIALKADKTYVDTQLALKANLSGATFTGEVKTATANGFSYRIITGNYGTFWLNNGSELYLMVTNSGDQNGSYNALRPLYMTLSTGALVFGSRPTWAGVTPWDTGNFNPASYAPVGGVGGQFIIGSSTHGTDGNIYMPWAADWLSNVLGAKFSIYGGTVSGNLTTTGEIHSNGILYSLGSKNSTTGAAANVWQNSTDGNYARSTSSLRYKRAIEPMWDMIGDLILQLKPIFYRSNALTIDPQDWSWYSFGAEDVAALDPRFVQWGKEPIRDADGKPIPVIDEAGVTIGYEMEAEDTPQSINTNAIISALVNLVQRQDARIAALEAARA